MALRRIGISTNGARDTGSPRTFAESLRRTARRSMRWVANLRTLDETIVVHVAPVSLPLVTCTSARALDRCFDPVAEGAYAHIGDVGGRAAENEGLNANLGLVVTPGGAVPIDSGTTYRSARPIDEAVCRVSAVPVHEHAHAPLRHSHPHYPDAACGWPELAGSRD